MKSARLKLTGGLYLVSVLLIHAFVFWNARRLVWEGYPDFTIYYTAGTMVREGMGSSLYDDVTQFKIQREFAPQVATRLGALPFNHPPFEALWFVPLTYVPYRQAYLLWALTNLAMLAVLPALLRAHVPALGSWPALVWLLVSLAFFPIFFALFQGQDAILLLFLYALTFAALKNGRLFRAGAWLACGLFKFHLILPFLILLLIQQKTWERRKKILSGFVSVGALLGALSLAVVGAGQMFSYPRYVLGLEATMARGAIMPADMPNLRGILYLMLSSMRHFEAVVLALSALLFVVAVWNLRAADSKLSDETMGDLEFCLAVFTTVLVSYHGLGYDLCILALPLLLLAGRLKSESGFSVWTRNAILAGSAALLFSPLQLVLLMRYNRLGLLGWAVLLCFVGLTGELRLQRRQQA